MSSLISQLENVISPVLEESKVDLVDVTYQKDYGNWVLCLFLDKENGFALSDCEVWSDKLGDIIDQSGLLEHKYVLEISSPGLYRPIKKLKDFIRFQGEQIAVKLYSAIDGRKNFKGILLGADENTISLKIENGVSLSLPRSQVAKCNLDPEFDF
jgi:ribosome maturation factor RimP